MRTIKSENKIEICKTLINNWNKRNLTIFGRLCYQITNNSKVYIPPPVDINTWQIHYLSIGWKQRKKWKEILLEGINNKDGIEVPDIEISLKTLRLKWLKLLSSNKEANWKIISKYYLNHYGSNLLIFKMDFYTDIIEYNIELNNINTTHQLKSFSEIRKQIIWGNRYIKFNGNGLIFHEWINAGLVFVNDMIDKNGETRESILSSLKIITLL